MIPYACCKTRVSYCTSYLDIPAGTYPENRLVDGAIGSYEDLVAAVGPGFGSIGAESTLDFQASIPLIWPQTTVLFQTDDEYWELVGSEGFFNSKINPWSFLHMFC